MRVLGILLIIGLMTACNNESKQIVENPFFQNYGTPFETPDFEKIKIKHFLPAYQKAVEEASADVIAIAEQVEEPTFENTIVALEKRGNLLNKVNGVFYNLTGAHTNDSLIAISKEVGPMLSKLEDDMYLNEKLFARVEQIWKSKEEVELNHEQARLLELYYKNFVRGGAKLDEEGKTNLRDINQQLSLLSIEFGDNVRNETNAFELVIEDKKDLAGLPETVIEGAAETAEAKGKNGWIFTVQKPSMIPFLQYAENRELRKQIYQAYINRGNNSNEYDNNETLKKIANLRVQKAQLLGYETHADYVLQKTMASKKENVLSFIEKIWEPALKMAQKEAAMMQAMMSKDGIDSKLESWDWWYYAEKIRKEKYDLNESEMSEYFPLEHVRQGAFDVANKLFGITFHKRKDIPVYHPEVEVFEVKEADGKHLGLLYTDYFPRESKSGGAWMNDIRGQHRVKGEEVTPLIVNVCNFTKPTDDAPALLTFDEVTTLFHEFGHALHGLLSNCTYPSLAGTSVSRDFVEFPSQIMENWAADPEVLKMFTSHYKTGQPIPDELIEKIKSASKFNQGFATVEYLAASYLDMQWHTMGEVYNGEVQDFENKALAEINLMPEIVARYKSTYFNHIFAGGYSSGYYSYIWSEVLDSDGYAYFKETDIFDKEKAEKLRKYVLSAGNSDDPMQLYKNFRGAEPDIEALLEKRGLKAEKMEKLKL